MKKLVTLFALGAMMLGLGGTLSTTSSAEAARPDQLGGAAGLIAAVVQVQDVDVVKNVNVIVALENVDIIKNVLNNSLNHLDITVIDGPVTVVDLIDVGVCEDALDCVDVLDEVNVDIDDIVAVVQVLGGGFVLVT